jgi:hypothetical protein
MKRLLFLLIFFSTAASAQYYYPFPLNGSLERIATAQKYEQRNTFFSFFPSSIAPAGSNSEYSFLSLHPKDTTKSWLARKLFFENFIQVDSPDFRVVINPLVDFQLGKDNDGNQFYVNTRGAELKGRIGTKWYFYTSYYENQAKFPTYIDSYVRKTTMVPGQGKARNFEGDAFDFAQAMGGLTYVPSRFFELSLGHGKNFMGDGYRSLLLSDASYSYPYFKASASFWKLRYTALWTSYTNLNIEKNYNAAYPKKFAAYHTLSILLGKHVELSLFDAVIWQDHDSTGQRGVDVNYLNPFIFCHPINFSMGSPDNAMIGGNLSIRMPWMSMLYGQVVIDDMDVAKAKKGSGFILTKYGYQLGLKSYQLFGIEGLFARAEYNQVQPYVYGHKIPALSYTNNGQAIAHPLGANFKEGVFELAYQHKRFSWSSHVVMARWGDDTKGSHWGHNIFLSDYLAERGDKTHNGYFCYGNYNGQGVQTDLIYQDHQIGIIINNTTNLRLVGGVIVRQQKQPDVTDRLIYPYVALRTSLTNLYYDF